MNKSMPLGKNKAWYLCMYFNPSSAYCKQNKAIEKQKIKDKNGKAQQNGGAVTTMVNF